MKEYLQTISEVMEAQGVNFEGLSVKAAEERLLEFGANKLTEGKKKTMIQRVWEQIKDPMVLVLIAAAAVSGSFGELADMIIIMIVVVLNAVLGIIQESKAEKAIESLQQMSAPECVVRREGVVCKIKTEGLVPGDLVLLEAGASVPADLRLIETASLKIEEAALTGESVPTDKLTEPLTTEVGGKDISTGDRKNMAYMGTNVSYGRGEGVVIATGEKTELGKIAEILADTEEEKTPLQKRLSSLSKVLSFSVLGICVFIFLFMVLREGGFSGGHVLEALLTAVSLAVAAIPEGLVVVVTVLLSIGVTGMSGRNAIIRRLTAVETLGCTRVICSDKTGTLTKNKMTVVDSYGDETLLAMAVSLCSDVNEDADGGLVGDPTEVALVEYADKKGLTEAGKQYKRMGEAPFDSIRKMMSVIFAAPVLESQETGYRQYTKGAPDEVLKKCTGYYQNGAIIPIDDKLKAEILAENKRMADSALRVLAGAFRDYTEMPDDMSPEFLERDLVFIGLTGMIDPVRPEVKAAVQQCNSAGIRPIMITGDHKDTAVAIAKELGMITCEAQAITGAELNEMSDKEFEKCITEISVYARVQPEHKVRIVSCWKKLGNITAMTGDGVNDAPAIKMADIGVGMGITGTDVTKNVADMVLSDDNFASIVYAVEEGRRIYDNIRKTVQFLLASNLSEVVSIFIATIFGLKLFAPIHILWINLVTDSFPAVALGMEASEPNSMKKKPRDSKESIFADGLGVQVIYQGITVALLTLISFFVGYPVSPETAMTMAFMTLSMCEIFHAVNMRSGTESIFMIKRKNMFLLGAVMLSAVLTFGVIYIPGINSIFELVRLPLDYAFAAILIAFAIIPIVEISKVLKKLDDR